jgi:type II secretory pathway component PulF
MQEIAFIINIVLGIAGIIVIIGNIVILFQCIGEKRGLKWNEWFLIVALIPSIVNLYNLSFYFHLLR